MAKKAAVQLAENKPQENEEFFDSRGIGLDATPGCFVCGGKPAMRKNLTAVVDDPEAGARIVAMFPSGARREVKAWTQVKIGVCPLHQKYLHQLEACTQENLSITSQMVLNILEQAQAYDDRLSRTWYQLFVLPAGNKRVDIKWVKSYLNVFSSYPAKILDEQRPQDGAWEVHVAFHDSLESVTHLLNNYNLIVVEQVTREREAKQPHSTKAS